MRVINNILVLLSVILVFTYLFFKISGSNLDFNFKSFSEEPSDIKINLIGLNYHSDEDILVIKNTIEKFYGFKCQIKKDLNTEYKGDTDKFLFKTKIISYDCDKIQNELGNYAIYNYDKSSDINIYITKSEIYNNHENVNGVTFGNEIYITTDLPEVWFKRVIVHEISHNFGLDHCTSGKCAMDSETSRSDFWDTKNDKPIFCDDCKSKLPKSQRFKLD